MSARESNAFLRLKERVCRPDDRFERIENGIGAGNPDVNYCMAGREGWIELKAPNVPAREDTPLLGGGGNHPLLLEQGNWFLKQHRAGGRGFLFVATKSGLMMLHGSMAWDHKFVNALTFAQMWKKAIWTAEVPVMDQRKWIELRQLLTK